MKSDKNKRQIRLASAKDREALYQLWQSCFHDTDAFTDYYFDYYFSENRVLMLSDEGQLKSMIHLNPYHMVLNGHHMEIDYIVGVATDENYRHRGAMRCLLQETFRLSYEQRKPFVYLMPADEAIYRPFQFAYIYDQLVEYKRTDLSELMEIQPQITCQAAVNDKDYFLITEMANTWFSKKYDLYTWRDSHYFRRLQLENQTDGGDLLLLFHENKLIGYLSYAKEAMAEIREVCCAEGYQAAVAAWLMQFFYGIKGEVLPSDQKGVLSALKQVEKVMRPIIMGRIIHLEEWMYRMPMGQISYALNIEVDDQYIAENNGVWQWQVAEGKMQWHPAVGCPDLSITIDGLMQWLTGYRSIDELEKSGQMILKSDCREILDKIPVLGGIFINEIV